MTQELNKWNIYEKVVAVVTDGEANIKAVVRHMNLPHLPCIAHKINLIVQNAQQSTDDNEAAHQNDADEDDFKTYT